MEAEVLRLHTNNTVCEARTENDILIVFDVPAATLVHLGDRLSCQELQLDVPLTMQNLSRNVEFVITVKRNDAHDLRLPMKHGSSRTPSEERLRGE